MGLLQPVVSPGDNGCFNATNWPRGLGRRLSTRQTSGWLSSREARSAERPLLRATGPPDNHLIEVFFHIPQWFRSVSMHTLFLSTFPSFLKLIFFYRKNVISVLDDFFSMSPLLPHSTVVAAVVALQQRQQVARDRSTYCPTQRPACDGHDLILIAFGSGSRKAGRERRASHDTHIHTLLFLCVKRQRR